MDQKLVINGVEIARDPFIILVGKVNGAQDKGNVQVQFGEEHATPSLADLEACRPSSAQLQRYARIVQRLEEAEEAERQERAALAADALRKEEERKVGGAPQS